MSIFGSNDSHLHTNVLSDTLLNVAYTDLMKEVEWDTMNLKTGIVPRLINIQGTIVNDLIPIYRHPSDKVPKLSEWTKTTKLIKEEVEKKLNVKFNHCILQYYKDGRNHITQHTDKTIDITEGSNIINLSLGATRTFILSNKITKEKQKIKLSNNSAFSMGWKTNKEWMHSIKQDKRDDKLKDLDEIGERISLTFRSISTFMDKDNNLIGQGSNITNQEKLIEEFSKENKQSDYEWEYANYTLV
jgi:alkylated DNA repair dioxygenase AlkB